MENKNRVNANQDHKSDTEEKGEVGTSQVCTGKMDICSSFLIMLFIIYVTELYKGLIMFLSTNNAIITKHVHT